MYSSLEFGPFLKLGRNTTVTISSWKTRMLMQIRLLTVEFSAFLAGKYREADEGKINPPPYLTCESFPCAVDHILQQLL